jgi:serine/threonine protein kinase
MATHPQIPGCTFVRFIGEGGFADVYLYQQNNPARKVAIKALKPEMATKKVSELFSNESRLLAKLGTHPHIIKIYQSGISYDGRPYIMMEFCDKTLSDIIKVSPLTPKEIIEVGISVCDAVATAHNVGVLHLDVKPGNLMYNSFGQLMLSDFGIAGTIEESSQTNAMTARWSAPELVSHTSSASKQTDIYSIGVTLYALATGHNPFKGDSKNINKLIISGKFDAKLQTIPKSISFIILKAMNKSVSERYQTAEEMITDLQKVQQSFEFTPTPVYFQNFSEKLEIGNSEQINTKKYYIPTSTNREYKSQSSKLTASRIIELQQQENKSKQKNIIIAGLSVAVVLIIGCLLFLL